MGLFKKAKEAAQQAVAQQPQGDGKVHVQGAGGMMDPAMFGGPSTRSVAADDPIGSRSTASRCRTTPTSRVTRRLAASPTRQE